MEKDDYNSSSFINLFVNGELLFVLGNLDGYIIISNSGTGFSKFIGGNPVGHCSNTVRSIGLLTWARL